MRRITLTLATGALAVAATALTSCSSSSSPASTSSSVPAVSTSSSMSTSSSASSSDSSSDSSSAASSSAPMAVGTNAAGEQTITVSGTDMLRFAPADIAVHVGVVHVTFKDAGSYPHNLSVPLLHKTSSTVTGTPGQQSTTFTLDFTKAGTYPFECTYHSSAGMKGRFVVTK